MAHKLKHAIDIDDLMPQDYKFVTLVVTDHLYTRFQGITRRFNHYNIRIDLWTALIKMSIQLTNSKWIFFRFSYNFLSVDFIKIGTRCRFPSSFFPSLFFLYRSSYSYTNHINLTYEVNGSKYVNYYGMHLHN